MSELIGFLVSVLEGRFVSVLLSLFLILIVLGRFEAVFTILMCYSNTSWPNQMLCKQISEESFVIGPEIQQCCVMSTADEWVRRNREGMRDRGSACTRLWGSSADYKGDEGSPGACTFLILDQRNSLKQAEVSSLLQICLILL